MTQVLDIRNADSQEAGGERWERAAIARAGFRVIAPDMAGPVPDGGRLRACRCDLVSLSCARLLPRNVRTCGQALGTGALAGVNRAREHRGTRLHSLHAPRPRPRPLPGSMAPPSARSAAPHSRSAPHLRMLPPRPRLAVCNSSVHAHARARAERRLGHSAQRTAHRAERRH